MSNRGRFLSWENLLERMDLGIPFLQNIPGSHPAHFFFEPSRQELGIRIMVDSTDLPLVQPISVQISIHESDRKLFLEIRSSDDLLLREFYDFCCEVIDNVQTHKSNPVDAVDAEWGAWVRLLDREAILSREKQIGLIGELWLLENLIRLYGFEAALESWHQDNSAEHDFGLPTRDIEVKTTTSEQRIHLIGSVQQLQPSNQRELFLLSVQLTPCARLSLGALSLGIYVELLCKIAPSTQLTKAFISRLQSAGWKNDHLRHYQQTYLLRTPPAIIRVDSNCPRITPAELEQLVSTPTERIKSVTYRIDVTGLGTESVEKVLVGN